MVTYYIGNQYLYIHQTIGCKRSTKTKPIVIIGSRLTITDTKPNDRDIKESKFETDGTKFHAVSKAEFALTAQQFLNGLDDEGNACLLLSPRCQYNLLSTKKALLNNDQITNCR